MKSLSVIAVGVVVGLMLGCGSSDVSAAKEVVHERKIELEGQSNFRDIGGYQTKDGLQVKWGKVYRSGELQLLSDSDVAKLNTLGIKTVANFLTKEEIDARGPDRLPDGMREIPLPMQAGNLGSLAAVVGEARITGDFSKVPPELNPEIHRMLINEASGHYAELLRELANPINLPMVYHCSHGVHRTGTATAILLSALGVPWETVREDYLLSNSYRGDVVKRRTVELRNRAAETFDIESDKVDMTNINAFYILEADYIDASLDEAVKRYGSMEAYIREGLGITDNELLSLRKELLVPIK